MSQTTKPRAQFCAEPGLFSVPAVIGALILFHLLSFIAMFQGSVILGADADHVAAAFILILAALCCLGGAVLLIVAFCGRWPNRLIPAAAVVFAVAAVLCGTATVISGNHVLGLLCVSLGLITPWWCFGSKYKVSFVVMFGVVSAPLLWQRWDVVDTSEWLCQPVPISVESKIHAAMKDTDDKVVALRATSTANVPGRWIIAGDVQDRGSFQGNPNVGFWLLIEKERPPDGQISESDTIYAINALADESTDFVLASVYKAEALSDRDAFGPAQDCLMRALSDKGDGT